ncbi:MAG: LacI family DNA-binding transcriptional regulator [Flavisolibacter sp.]
MKPKKLAISDIAKELNISTTTISFILNGKAEEKRISLALTEKVLKRVKEMGYVPNQLAKSLRTGKTNILGLIVEDISNSFFATVAHMIEEEVNKKGYKIFYCSSENNAVKMKDLIKVLRESQVDGFIITPAEGSDNEIKKLIDDKANLILFDRYLPELDTNYVVLDNSYGSYLGVKHLIERGHRKIGFITTNSRQSQMQERLEGYIKAVSEYGLKQYIKKVSFFDESAVIIESISGFLKKNKALDAVFFATNYLGIYGLESISKLNYKIPSDLAVISFDDHDIFRLYTPSISAISQPIAEMSKTLIQILLDQLEQKPGSVKNRKVTFRPTLIIRDSTK